MDILVYFIRSHQDPELISYSVGRRARVGDDVVVTAVPKGPILLRRRTISKVSPVLWLIVHHPPLLPW